ncbi:extracellular solute-binding protein [Enterovirga rhinocerotis]|uniref:Putative spermidine/putrescine transport system substrate-binding protein n=1 Tax=Enterovirga rhinocerotis TaxID=1339210 RepID=A0A4R7C4V2_9HYPH|nr:extracellular solute-binding protein [Enterovirga rhinocerotis]TDR93053.1 putative spermidine/putrescine transport system substrate-binding protein [Enterovirga rhinocerotis]
MKRRLLSFGLAAAVSLFTLVPVQAQAQAQSAICYNCPPEWANWGAMLKQIKADLNISIPGDNKNSGQAIAQIIAERASPVADIAYLGVNAGISAAGQDLVEAWKPERFAEIPDGLKDKDGRWWAVHQGTLGLFVNVDALDGKPVPACWADLKKPEYKGLVGYLDPTSAAVGFGSAVAINTALGGSLDNFDPAIAYLKALAGNGAIVTKQTSYARTVSGEIPILMDYDFNAYRAKYSEDGKFEFVLPCEGSVSFPYVMTLVKGAPHRETAKKVLNYLLSDKGQLFWSSAYLRPALPVELPAEVAKRFLPQSEYARAVAIDWAAAQAAQTAFSQRYLKEVR